MKHPNEPDPVPQAGTIGPIRREIVFEPLPIAAKLLAGALGHCFFFVLSHQR